MIVVVSGNPKILTSTSNRLTPEMLKTIKMLRKYSTLRFTSIKGIPNKGPQKAIPLPPIRVMVN